MTQLSLKATIKEWGQDATLAAEAEAIHCKDLTLKQLKKVLKSHMFLLKKRNTAATELTVGNCQHFKCIHPI